MNPLAVFAITLGTGVAVGLLRWYGIAGPVASRELEQPRPVRSPALDAEVTGPADGGVGAGRELPEAA